MQTILVILIFAGALIYLGWIVKNQFTAKNSCAKGCGCSAVDLEKIEKQIKTSGNK
ncbi:MAG TPA: hypothetical protein VNB90_08460 [Cytophagaceae bacterium]|nr:hypothetical protein [Cytophagaceae bacterium]